MRSLQGISFFLVLVASVLPAQAKEVRVPSFHALYDVRIKGVKVAKAEFILSRQENGEYIYQQNSKTVGMAAWFRKEKIKEISRWKLTDKGIIPIQYIYSRQGGDDDKEVDLVFNWQQGIAENRVSVNPWSLEVPLGTLDKMVMQVAMLMDLSAGERKFNYPIADKGRLKNYEFEVVGEEMIELPNGLFNTIKLSRMNDDNDKTYIWSAPDLQYMPVRFMKQKEEGFAYEINLKEIINVSTNSEQSTVEN